MSAYRIVVVDDELANCESLERILVSDGATVETFQDPQQALLRLRKGFVDVLLTDLRMSNWSGMDLLETTKLVDPSIEVILVTAFGTVELAVEAMKKGAYDFITKPLQRIQVLKAVHKALEKRQLVIENSLLKEEINNSMLNEARDLVGRSEALGRVMEIARQASKTKATVLIEGESGTGKGMLAEYIHRLSQQKNGLFVKINCTSIPDNLLEAELFGYEQGAFTGANKRKKGRVEIAHNGTMFLDEIGIAPITLQTKLLRFLQDGEFERLGGIDTLKVDTRVVSATNTDLKKAIQNGEFREDLFYRLNVIHIRLPALRERREDIPLLAKKFIEESAKKNGREIPLIDGAAIDSLINYSWPGNIRELQNLMERAVVLNSDGLIKKEDFPIEVTGSERSKSIVIPLGLPIKDVEKLMMKEALFSTKGDKRLAAKLLGIHPRTVYRYLEAESSKAEDVISENSVI